MSDYKVIHFLRDDAAALAVELNRISRANNIVILDKNNKLIQHGFLKIVKPLNEFQKKFCNDKQCIVSLSKKGKAFLTMVMK